MTYPILTERAGAHGQIPTSWDNAKQRIRRLARVALIASLAIMPASAQAFSVIRDTEIESILQSYAQPMLDAAGFPPNAMTILLVNDPSINAFATPGNMVFFHTGLILAADNSSQVIGVLAHEIGHIAGADFVTSTDAMAAASTTALLATLLGVAAGVASGNPDVGIAAALGGQGTAQRMFFAFNRGQESEADQFALRMLEKTEQSPRGLYDFFSKLRGQELLITDRQDPYVRTHPLTRERMDTVNNAVNNSPFTDKPLDPERERQHRRMVAKLFAFLKPQMTVFQRFPDADNSPEARYAKSIAYYRRGQLKEAVPLIDSLIADEPEDPYYWELKGQMLLENSRIEEAIVALREATRLLPGAPLIQVMKAHAMVESGDPQYAPEAQEALKAALRVDPQDSWAWDLAAKSYLQSGNPGMSAYAAAERALLTGQFGDVVRYTRQAEELLEKDTPTWYRLQDIKVTAQNYLQDAMEKRRGR